MKKIRLKVIGLSYHQAQTGSYIVIMAEIGTDRKLPVVIKHLDAQYITLKNEGVASKTPMIQDFFKIFAKSFDINVSEVFIYDVVEGIFKVKMVASNIEKDIEIECSIGDALSMSILFKCPITCTEHVLNVAGVYMNNDGTQTEEHKVINSKENRDTTSTLDNLVELMKKAVESEEYEAAAKLRDKINKIDPEALKSI